MMKLVRNVRLKRLHVRLGEVMYELTKVNFSKFAPQETWRPAVNAYRLHDAIDICVDLAGVAKGEIELEVEPRRLWMRGWRRLPEPAEEGGQPLQILAMEIDHGTFEREIELAPDVDPELVTATQKNGLLWIHLPLRAQA